MTIIIKNKGYLIFDDFRFRCCVGKKGFSNDKFEGDMKTPIGEFSLENLYFRKDRKKIPKTRLKIIKIKKNMGWCNDIKSKKNYNKLIKMNSKFRAEKLFRSDYKYDFFIPIKYNWGGKNIGKGSAIFIHITKNYKPTAGCIGLSEKDFLILVKLVKRNTKVKIT